MTLLATKTQTSSTVSTAVAVAVAVVLATTIGTGIAVSQWQQNNKVALTVEDIDVETTLDDVVVLRGDNTGLTEYGMAVANVGDINGDGYEDLVVGDAGEAGTVYGYYGGADSFDATVDWTIVGDGLDDFGYSVAAAGDVNNDGYSDVLVGAKAAGDAYQGSVMMYYGSATGPRTDEADWKVSGGDNSTNFGQVVAGLGDINGDSYADIAVFTGGYAYEDTDTYFGPTGSLVSVYLGSATGPDTTVDWTYLSDEPSLEQLMNLAAAGDVNGDGYADMVFGNPEMIGRRFGQMAMFYGSSTGFELHPNLIMSTVNDDYFGGTVAAAGDVNADGYDDVMVGSVDYSNGESSEGAAYVYYGSSTGLSRYSRKQIESNVEDALMGMAITAIGDANGDGYDDVVVTAPRFDRDGDGSDLGQAMLYGGSATGMLSRPLGITGATLYDGMDAFGERAVAGSSLVDTAGTDIVIAVEQYDDGISSGPAVLVYPNVDL